MENSLKHGRRRVIIRLLRFNEEQGGAVMVEFAIIAPLFIFLITGTIQLMGISHADSLMQYSNFMALRAGAVHYENIEKRWDPNKNSSGDVNQRLNTDLTKVMEDAVWHGFGPFASGIAGYENLSSVPNMTGIRTGTERAISHAPAAVFNIDVTAGTLSVANQKYLPRWISSQTRVDLGLPMPWVGTAIAGLHRTAGAPTEQEMAARGMDPFSNVNNPFTADDETKRALYSMDFIPLTSDANLDQRSDNWEARSVMWPLNSTSIQVHHGGTGAATHGNNIDTGAQRAQPATMPIQSRFR
jgi:hypothetical protein